MWLFVFFQGGLIMTANLVVFPKVMQPLGHRYQPHLKGHHMQ